MIISTSESELSGAVTTLKNINYFTLVGSRAIFDEINADWDFMAIDSGETRSMLVALGFYPKYHGTATLYLDSSSTQVYVKNDSFGNILNVQVVLKQPEKYDYVKQFWSIMRRHPQLFKLQFWKSYVDLDGNKPTTQDMVQTRINHWVDYVIPYSVVN